MGSNDSGSVKADGFPKGKGDMSKKKKQVTLQPGERTELDSSVKVEPVEVKLRAIADGVSQEAYESLAQQAESMVLGKGAAPIPREDEARPCTLCESRRPIGRSYSRVYCTKANVRYCKCSYCGHTWPQERK